MEDISAVLVEVGKVKRKLQILAKLKKSLLILLALVGLVSITMAGYYLFSNQEISQSQESLITQVSSEEVTSEKVEEISFTSLADFSGQKFRLGEDRVTIYWYINSEKSYQYRLYLSASSSFPSSKTSIQTLSTNQFSITKAITDKVRGDYLYWYVEVIKDNQVLLTSDKGKITYIKG